MLKILVVLLTSVAGKLLWRSSLQIVCIILGFVACVPHVYFFDMPFVNSFLHMDLFILILVPADFDLDLHPC